MLREKIKQEARLLASAKIVGWCKGKQWELQIGMQCFYRRGTKVNEGFDKSMLLILEAMDTQFCWLQHQWLPSEQNHPFIEASMKSQQFEHPPAVHGSQPKPTQVDRNLFVDFKRHWLVHNLSLDPLRIIKAILCNNGGWTQFPEWYIFLSFA